MEENKEKLIVNNPAEEATPEESLKAVIAKQAIEEEASGSKLHPAQDSGW